MKQPIGFAAVLVVGMGGIATTAVADTYQVGPTRNLRQLSDLPSLSPGDVVELDGDATYSGGVSFYDNGSASQPIVIRGVSVGGKRPVISGGTNTISLGGNHYRLDNIEVTGGSFRCVFHVADDITLERVVIRDCPRHGLLGADEGSGSLTLRNSEVYNCGGDLYDHQIYMATDESSYPGSVFRMEHNYVHDARGGHNVKSRAERNEIYYNWIEGAGYHELELIGPDGQSESLAREDADVVGNVLRKSGSNAGFYVIRVGGDGTGQTWGRFRFAYNTILLASGDSSAVFRIFDGVDSVEMHNNVIVRQGGDSTPIKLYRTLEASWSSGQEVVSGAGNWIPSSSIDIPPQWTDTVQGSDPGLADLSGLDLFPVERSAVLNAARPTQSPPGFSFPSPLLAPAFQPSRSLVIPGAEIPRVGDDDIGAFELPGAIPPMPPGDPPPGDEPPADDPPGGGPGESPGETAGCGIGGAGAPDALLVSLLLLAVLTRCRQCNLGRRM